jgi:hypothetical protein
MQELSGEHLHVLVTVQERAAVARKTLKAVIRQMRTVRLPPDNAVADQLDTVWRDLNRFDTQLYEAIRALAADHVRRQNIALGALAATGCAP